MLEKDLNHDLIKLFAGWGWAYKIPDAKGKTALATDKRPFDGLAAFEGFDFFFESKLIKNKISAFSIARIEPHQFENLLKLRELGKETAVILGIWIARKTYLFLTFDVYFLYTLECKSILKKQIEGYISDGYAFDMRQAGSFKPGMLLERRIDGPVTGRGNGKVHK